MDITTFCQGYWEVGQKKFANKQQALVHSNITNELVHFRYFDEVFENTDRTKLGQIPLNLLYKQRADQLREKYDYLILYFSGGADSYNILRTFLDNNIKLDEVCVKWCMQTKHANSLVYVPNNKESSAYNYLSEYDLSIKPVLQHLAENHKQIHIEIVDWLPNVETALNFDTFNMVNNWHDIELPSMVAFSPNETKQVELGKKVGCIYGIDKPKIFYYKNDAYMYFSDGATTMGVPNPINPTGVEYFYWTPDMPNLAYEMAYKVIKWELSNYNFFNNFAVTDEKREDFKKENAKVTFNDTYQIHEEVYRNVLYTNWDNRFQAKKPIELDRTDKHNWILKFSQLNNYKDSYSFILQNYITDCNKDYLVFSDNGKVRYRLLPSKKHLVLKSYKQYLNWN
jgi:hypothetical protein